jgi:hypothetical protein
LPRREIAEGGQRAEQVHVAERLEDGHGSSLTSSSAVDSTAMFEIKRESTFAGTSHSRNLFPFSRHSLLREFLLVTCDIDHEHDIIGI